ncbi:MAG: hypothetical protein NXI22_12005 [bacterium]|nr:hypothetical protein [bacterium]
MKRFAFFSLEGLFCQRGQEVWVTLGTFSTRADALQASNGTPPREVAETRIIAHFRDASGGVAKQSPVRPHMPINPFRPAVSTTVA